MQDFIRRIRRAWRRFTRSISGLGRGHGKKNASKSSGRSFGARFRRMPVKGKAILISGTALILAVLILLTSLLFKGCGNQNARVSAEITIEETPAANSNSVVNEDGSIGFIITPAPTVAPTPYVTQDPTLKRGMEGSKVQVLQERLMQLGFLDIDESTQLYGPATEKAVEMFQRQVNFTEALDTHLDEDGWAGELTLSVMYSDEAPSYCIKEGMEGSDITDLQDQLVDLGYMNKSTGYYGDETVAAVKAFQSRNNLSADGLAGSKTYDMLYSPNAKESASKAQQARTKANIEEMIEVAKSKLGCKYVLGAEGPKQFDCSGLVYYCLKEAGSNRRRLNAAGYSQVSDWEKITSINSLKKGDLICFYNDGYTKVGHIGIVVSSGMMIDASSSNGKVVRRSYTTSYWRNHFVCGRRPW